MIGNLKRLRKEKGVTQRTLADAVMVSQQSINKYENHSVEPDIDTLIRIADYFGVSLDYLVGRETPSGHSECQADPSDIRRLYDAVRSFAQKYCPDAVSADDDASVEIS